MVTTAISPASLSTALLFFNFLTWVLPSLAAIIPPQQRPQPKYTFTEHCADDHDKDFLSCAVSTVDCNIDLTKLIPPPSGANPAYPSEAHDVRIEPFSKAMAQRDSGDGQSHHQLLVDISWQTPPNNSTHALKAFLLEIEGDGGRKHDCFLLNISGTRWTPARVAQSPRLHFSSNSLFSFAQTYDIELYSLPEKSAGVGASVHTRFTTPHNPNGPNSAISSDLISANCSKQSNQFASKWTAGFRHIYVHSAARIMQVEFVGAPPQYCFESYEVRLLDETGLELLYSGTVTVEDMEHNGNMIIGQYNFTDLEYDRMYIPSVIPVERAADSRCLCPVFGTDPYDVKVVCSCVAADWRPVRMTRPDVVKLCPDCSANQSVIGVLPPPMNYKNPSDQNKTGLMWSLLVAFNTLFLLLLCIFIIAYMRCRSNGTIPRKMHFQPIRFVAPTRKDPELQKGGLTGGGFHPGTSMSSTTTSSLAIRTNLGLGTVSTTSSSLLSTPLISAEEREDGGGVGSERALNVLIVYAHDNEAHERAVIALAELLRDVFHLEISVDRWDLDKIERNQTDWLSASVVAADKVLVINSAGAMERYHAKISTRGRHVVERIDSDPLDHLFVAHIDMALQHHSIVSTRFNYTSSDQILPTLLGCLQYNLPDNVTPLVSAIFGRNLRHDPRLAPASPQLAKLREAIDGMAKLCVSEPNWLGHTHRRLEQCNDKMEMQWAEEGDAVEDEERKKMRERVQERRRDRADTESALTSKSALKVELPLYEIVDKKHGKGGCGGGGRTLDSGIFEWGGGNASDEDSGSGGGTAEDDGESAELSTEINSEEHVEMGAQACIVDGKVVGHEKVAAKFGDRTRVDAERAAMDSGLVEDEAPTSKADEHSPMLAVV